MTTKNTSAHRAIGWFVAILLISPCEFLSAVELASRSTDRTVIERVYHNHRLGNKQPFEQTLPVAMLEQMVRQDLRKEVALKKTYGVEITSPMIAAEVRRIEATTRAPEILAEIKHALDDDPARFADAMARPIIVERELRRRFDNDDTLHAPQRREAEHARELLRAGQSIPNLHEVTWQVTARPDSGISEIAAPPPQTQGIAKSGAYSVEATAQVAQTLIPPPTEGDRKIYFADLDPELQKVLAAQLQKPGDVSAVIETPSGFLIFQAKARNAEILTAASLSIPKRSYDEWLAQQPE